MEKLELKHIAPYLPYSLQGLLIEKNDDCFIVGASEDYVFTDSFYDELDYSEIKPTLRPIEDLHNEETDCGIKIIQYFNFRTNSKIDYTNFPYKVMEELFRNHFDVFGLITKGLAVTYLDVERLDK